MLTPEQKAGLDRFCGCEVCVRWWQENVADICELNSVIEEVDVIAAVLPIHLLAQLVQSAQMKPVLIGIAKRTLVSTGDSEPMVRFSHGGWQKVAKLELELAPVE
jgi:hypothetical protein